MANTPINITGATTIVGFSVTPPFVTTDNYTFSFPYISEEDFEIEVNSETILDAADFEFTSTYLINLTSTGVTKLQTLYGTETSVPVTIRRRTQLDSKLVDYSDGATLTEEELDLMSTQLFYLIQEVYDTTNLETVSFNPVDNSIDLDGAILADVGEPTGESHAATLGTLRDNVITPDYAENGVYRTGRMVFYSGDLYRANTDIAAAPAVFDAGDWDVVLTAAQLAAIATNTADIATNTGNIATNTADIATNTGNIGTNTGNIGTNTTGIGTNASNHSSHVGASSAHGVSGDVLGTTDAQTVTNKTFDDSITLKELASTPSTPASGYKAIYPKNDGKFYTLDDAGNEVEIGSGGTGDAFAIHLIKAENLLNISEVDLSGNNADFDGGGSITTAPALSTTAADLIKSEKVIKYDPDADGSNDYFGFTKSIPRGLRGRHLGFVFEYKNDSTTVDDDFRFAVKQKDGTNAGDIEYFNMEAFYNANGASTLFSVASYITDDCTEIEFGFQNTSTTTTVELYVDNILVTANPFTYKNLQEESHLHISQDHSAMTNLAGEIEWNLGTATINTGGKGYITTEDDSGNTRTKFNMTSSGHLTVNWGFKKQNNGTVTEPHVNHYNSAGTLINEYQGFGNSLASSSVSMTVSFEVSAGDFVCVEADGNDLSASTGVDHVATFNLRSQAEHTITPAESGTEYYRVATTDNFWDGTGLQDTIDVSLVDLSSSNFLEWNDTTESRLVAKQDIILNVSVVAYVSADDWVYIRDSDDTALSLNRSKTDAVGYISTSVELKLNKGDYIYFQATLGSGAGGGLVITARPANVKALSAIPMNYTQTKTLSADVTTTTTSISDLTFSNLVIGNWYELSVYLVYQTSGNDTSDTFEIKHDSSTLLYREVDHSASSRYDTTVMVKFQATATTVTCDYTRTASNLLGNGTQSETFAQLTELNYTKETTRFT